MPWSGVAEDRATRAKWAAVLVVLVVAALLWRAREPGSRPEPIRFVAVDEAAFGDPGTLTDAWADVDGDGDPDRFTGFNGAPARLYLNQGPEGFVESAEAWGVALPRRVRTTAWGDYDLDGDPDLFLGFAGDGPVVALFRNDEAEAGFTEVTEAVGLGLEEGSTRQAAWVDVDADGDLDLFLALRDRANRLWRNDGGTFTDVTEDLGVGDERRSVGAVWFDADSDGDLDLYVGNMDGDANGMWRNDGGSFTDVAEAWGLADGGRALGDPEQGTVRPCVADWDGDGDLDLYTANYGPNGLLENPGEPGRLWRNRASETGLAGSEKDDACLWADVDHDGRLELFVNGTVTGGVQYPDRLFRWRDGSWVNDWPAELEGLALDHGATWVDYDGDGDLDLSLCGAAEDGSHPLIQNLLRPEYAWHSIRVTVLDERGLATMAGAEVRIYAAGTRELIGMGLVDSGSGYNAQSVIPVHVAVPGGEPVDVVVTVPGSEGSSSAILSGVDPAEQRGRVLEVRVAR